MEMKRSRRRIINWAALVGIASSIVPGTSLVRPAGAVPSSITERVSIGTAGEQGNDISGRFAGPAIDADGSVVAFDSVATTLVPGDTNRDGDVFVRDRSTNTTERVSIRSNGSEANDVSTRPALDATGNLVAFDSSATNLVPRDTNQLLDVFAHNRTTHRTQRVSVSSDEVQGAGSSNSPSVGGRFVSFVSSASNLVPGDTNGQFDVFIHDRQTGVTERVSVSSNEAQGDATSVTPTVSRDGRFVAFWSDATNLVRDDTNDRRDVFVRDRALGTTERVSVSS